MSQYFKKVERGSRGPERQHFDVYHRTKTLSFYILPWLLLILKLTHHMYLIQSVYANGFNIWSPKDKN